MRLPKCDRVRDKAGREIPGLKLRRAGEFALDPLLAAGQKQAGSVVQPLAEELR